MPEVLCSAPGEARPRLNEVEYGASRALSRTLRAVTIAAVVLVLGAASIEAEDRSIDGSGNNETNTTWGAANTQLIRIAAPQYADDASAPAGATRSSARAISNAVVAQPFMIFDEHQLSAMVFQWGQFIDHDMDLSDTAAPAEPFPIAVPLGDPHFDPTFSGTQVIPLDRSIYDTSTGLAPGNPRQQINQITSYLDGSMIYGSDAVRADMLRAHSGGRLKTSADNPVPDAFNLLPFNNFGLPNATGGNPNAASFYVAGDVRANEQMGLTAMHTLFVREHNRLAAEIQTANPGWSDDQIYERARKIVGAEIQAITYNEFLPAILGADALPVYTGYDDSVNATIANEFSAALFRVGHTMLAPQLLRMQDDGTPAPDGALDLRDAFFVPASMPDGTEIDYLLKGLAMQPQQQMDSKVIDDVRNFLFGPPGAGGFDLASLNIQRGRDHGLADYNAVREAFGLPMVATFADITSDPLLQSSLAAVYGDINDIDLWVGALAEDHYPGAALGELLRVGITDQFIRLRDGDRFWYQNDPELADLLGIIEGTRLSDIVMRNTGITHLQSNVFVVPEPSTIALGVLGSFGAALIVRRRRQKKIARSP